MESTRGCNAPHLGVAGKTGTQTESPEQLLDVFKAAALSVTKLYKKSAAAESTARIDGYQECLNDILAFLDKGNLGLDGGEGGRIRMWATERLGREGRAQSADSDDEIDKTDTTCSSEISRTNMNETLANATSTNDCGSFNSHISGDHPEFLVPVQNNFTFQSLHPYPNIDNLNLSDPRPHDGASVSSRAKVKKTGPRASSTLGRGTGSKRKMDFTELFGGCLSGKDFGSVSKRSRHI